MIKPYGLVVAAIPIVLIVIQMQAASRPTLILYESTLLCQCGYSFSSVSAERMIDQYDNAIRQARSRALLRNDETAIGTSEGTLPGRTAFREVPS